MATQINQENWRYHLRRGITDLWFILSLVLALLLFLILVGYHNTDPGWSTSGTEGKVQHWLGASGAYISDALFSLTGYACYLLPLGLILIGWQSVRRTYLDAELIGWKLFALLFSLIALSGILTLRGGEVHINSLAITAGGVVGQKMNIELLKMWPVPFIMMIYTAVFILGVTLMAEFSWLKMLERIGFYVTLVFRKLDSLDRNDGVTDRRKPTLEDETISQRRRQNLQERIKVIDLDAQAQKEYEEAEKMATPPVSSSEEHRSQPSFNLSPAPANSEPSFFNFSQNAESNPPPSPPPTEAPRQSPLTEESADENNELVSWARYKTIDEKKPATPEAEEAPISKVEQQPALAEPTSAPQSSQPSPVVEEKKEAVAAVKEEEKTAPPPQPPEAPAPKVAEVSQAADVPPQDDSHPYVNYKPRHHADSKPAPLTAVNDEPQMDNHSAPAQSESDAPIRVRLNTFQDAPMKQYPLPPLDLLNEGTTSVADYSAQELDEMAMRLENALKNYKLNVRVENIAVGPVVTRLELSLAAGVKVSQISNLEKDIARSLAVPSVRVVEVIPGKPFIGLEMPNEKREIVSLRGILESGTFQRETSPLTMVLGVDVGGKPMVADLRKMPHLLVAGTTGSGKSVGINVMLTSMLFKSRPEDLRLILIDPKRLEMTFYADIPHLLTPVITDMLAAENALCWAVAEMERRFQLLAEMKVRKIDEFNKMILEAEQRGESVANPFYRVGTEMQPTLKKLPYIVIVIDELADLMMVAGKNVEQLIARIAQKARAAGIHLILATQRPSVDVITGLIKSNIPTRIAFQVSSKIDSRIILDNQGAGAESLLGYGDMLYAPAGTVNPLRVHGAFIDDQETDRLTTYLRAQDRPHYEESITTPIDVSQMGALGAAGIMDSNG